MDSYAQAVLFLLSLGNEVKSARLGLQRIEALLEALGRPERAFRSVHVAGTNGKGSTAAMIDAGLRAAGFRTGLYTSPHLVRINERIRVAAREISDDDFCAGLAEVRAVIERLLAAEALDVHPTYFECITALAFRHFERAGVERAVVEVGLGGRLDATNVVRPELAVITPIDFDHEAFLGKRAAAIAAEKAGILKAGVPAVIAPQRPEAAAVLEARAQDLAITVVRPGCARDVTHAAGCYRFDVVAPSGAAVRAELALAGEHQVTNALVAIAVLDTLGVDAASIERGLREARWPGRLERVAERPLILLDGAHNPAGARALARHIEQHHRGQRLWLVYAAMRDKAVDEVAGLLFPLAHRVLITRVQQPRAISSRELATVLAHHHPDIRAAESLPEALALARAEASEADLILITGSLFLVGEAKALVG